MTVKTCVSCGAENDATRVFCTNCGTRLPEELTASKQKSPSVPEGRSAPAVSTYRPTRPIQHQKLKQPSLLGPLLSQLFFTAATAAIIACLIQMARSPDHVPAEAKPDAVGAKKTFEALRQCGSSPAATTWTVNAAAINEFLASTITMVPTADKSSFRAEFRRAFVILHEGDADFVIQQRLLTRDIYFQLRGVPVSSPTGLSARAVGAYIGRMPIHPMLLPAIMPLFKPSISGLDQATTILQKASMATITPTAVLFKWPDSSPKSLL